MACNSLELATVAVQKGLVQIKTMKRVNIASVATGLLLGMSTCISVAWSSDGPPTGLKPAKVVAVGLNVIDLEGQKAWYEAKLGMAVVASELSADGSPGRYYLGYQPLGLGTASVILARLPAGQPRSSGTGMIVLGVPNAKGLTEWLKDQGVENVQISANVSYSIKDPEGNFIVLYTPASEIAGSEPASSQPPGSRCGNGPVQSRLLAAAQAMIAAANPYQAQQAQEMFQQGLMQQDKFDEEYARCIRSNPAH